MVISEEYINMGPEDPSNRKKYPSFLLMPNFRKLQEDSKNVSEGVNGKKTFSFGHCPNDGGGSTHARIFWPSF